MLAAAGFALVLAACGSSPGTASTGDSASQPGADVSTREGGPWTEPQLRRLAGLRRNPVDLTYALVGHPECVAGSLLRSPAEIQSYKAAGDIVVTTSDGSAGVKVSGQSPACQRLFATALAKVH